MDLGAIQGDELRFLHQAFITDTIGHAVDISKADVRLYYIDEPERCRLVEIITEYLKKKSKGARATALNRRFDTYKMDRERWGLRVEKIFKDCFNQGYKSVLLVGSRTPTINSFKLTAALKALEQSDAVFGPTPEGRYYVIGMSGEYKVSLAGFDWKSPTIYSEVSEAFTKKGLNWAELEIWYCVEGPDELELMVRDINQYRFEGDETTAHETEIVMGRLLTKLG